MEAQRGLNKNLSHQTITTIHIYYLLYKNKQGKMSMQKQNTRNVSKSSIYQLIAFKLHNNSRMLKKICLTKL